jgi:hypothetical protein
MREIASSASLFTLMTNSSSWQYFPPPISFFNHTVARVDVDQDKKGSLIV